MTSNDSPLSASPHQEESGLGGLHEPSLAPPTQPVKWAGLRRPRSTETKAKIAAGMKLAVEQGRTLTPEHRARLSKAAKARPMLCGRWDDPAFRAAHAERSSARMSAMWQDPAFRERALARLKAGREQRRVK